MALIALAVGVLGAGSSNFRTRRGVNRRFCSRPGLPLDYVCSETAHRVACRHAVPW